LLKAQPERVASAVLAQPIGRVGENRAAAARRAYVLTGSL
jgi:hypothetical protein